MISRVAHLARRWSRSLSRSPIAEADVERVREVLSPAEFDLWSSMSLADRRHSIEVADRFERGGPAVGRAQIAGALLHDVGKTVSGLGTSARVLATIVGPRGRRFADYHCHEELGAAMLEACGSDPVTVALVRNEGESSGRLRAADDV